ncbi:MAG: T9SS type A sorting domain-containing protein [Bacteroidales bacterium]|nr:T9SS type A sorting domain-containing protein [Bacteroidales bacterium]
MKKKILFFAFILSCAATLAQNEITLVFKCRTVVGQRVTPERITIANISRGWMETLFQGDTIYTLNVTTGIETEEAFKGTSLQAVQNPFDGNTTVDLNIGTPADVEVVVSDMSGRIVFANGHSLQQAGTCRLNVSLRNPGTYVMNVRVSGQTLATKLVNTGKGVKDEVEFGESVPYKTLCNSLLNPTESSSKGSSTHPFQLGDLMQYVAYAPGVMSQLVTQYQNQSEELLMEFSCLPHIQGDAQPCPDAPTLTDCDGNVYNTVQIGNQCWMKENLRTTRYANGDSIPFGTSIANWEPRRYYPNNDSANVYSYGYLYNWTAVMHGSSGSDEIPSGVQGVCPTGWHVPSRAEWYQLTAYVGGQSPYVCGGNPSNIAKALAAETSWVSNVGECKVGDDVSTNNSTGFSALPAGAYGATVVQLFGTGTHFWTSRSIGDATYCSSSLLYNYYSQVYFSGPSRGYGLSVRCLRD